MNTENIYEQTFTIYSNFVDDNRYLTMPNLMYFMQEVAWAHSNNNDIGWHFLQTKNMFWALVKLYIHIERMPQWNEPIRIRTWGRPSEWVVYPREFEVFDKEDKRIIAATSAWVILDKEHFKPQMIQLENEKGILFDKCVFDGKIPKITKQSFEGETEYFPVLHSDIDMNKHVNNTRYMAWVLDEYGHDFHQHYRIKTCNIHFMKQTKFGEYYGLQRNEITPNTFVSSIFTRNQSTELCRIELEWKKNN
ncbi:MAG: hypothetical protein KBA86_06755 [Bacteroidales bacterium]|nr:hypothetical protein [Bacteroidales bacterium]